MFIVILFAHSLA